MNNNIVNNVIPGIDSISFKNHLVPDLIFLMSVVALPSSFFNFINKSFFVDLRLLFFTVGIFYLIFNFRYITKIFKINGGRLLCLVSIYLIIQFVYSILVKEIIWVEVLTIFRTNFCYPIITLGFLCYAAKMDNKRLYRFFYWLLVITFIQGILYLIANIFGINFYANTSKDFYEFQGQIIIQNLQSLPFYNIILYAFSIISLLIIPKFNKHWLWIVPIFVTVLSIVRNQMIVFFLIILVLYIFGILSNQKIKISRISKSVFVFAFCSIIALSIFPNHIGRVIEKFGFNKQEEFSLADQGTYQLRLNLIEESFNRTANNDNLIFGHGYIREARKGRYDFVIGGDTFIAPVIFTEGLFGMFIRYVPIVYFLFYGLRNLRNRNKKKSLFALLIIALLIPEIFNAVQTTLAVHYHNILFVIYLLMIVLHNDKRKRIKQLKFNN